MTDDSIIQHLQRNQYSSALKGLYSVLPEVTKYIKANSGTAEDAQDIFQDALVILHRKVNSENFTLTSSLKNFLFAVAKNCWLRALRDRKKVVNLAESGYQFSREPDTESNHDLAALAFNLLGEKCKELLIQFYFKKKSYTEIANSLAFSDEKVAKNQKYRCLQKAKEHYSDLLTHTHAK